MVQQAKNQDFLLSEKYNDEQKLTNQGSFSLQIPFSINNKCHYPKRIIPTTKLFKEERETTSKLPFNLDLDNVLFISTLARYKHEYKQPETHPSNKVIPCTSTSDSSSSASCCYDMRRISIQSDTSNTTCYSAEPIRRFSSVSTISSFSSISSSINKRIPSPSISSDILTMTSNHNSILEGKKSSNNTSDSSSSSTGSSCSSRRSSSSFSNNQQDDPGHTHCDTLHSPNTIDTTAAELPLYQPWVFYFIDYNKRASSSVTIKPLFTCSTVWQFASGWRTVKNHTRVSRLQPNQNICCFVQEVQPLWEHEANRGGGRLLIYVKQLDDVFEWLLCALIGANLDDEVVGIVAAKKQYRDRVEVWMNDKVTPEQIPLFKEKLCNLLDSTCHNEINAGRYKKHSMEHT